LLNCEILKPKSGRFGTAATPIPRKFLLMKQTKLEQTPVARGQIARGARPPRREKLTEKRFRLRLFWV
jgi:hypothetical protein